MTIEKTILNQLATNDEYARKVLPFLKEEYFSDYSFRTVYKLIDTYINDYNNVPSKQALLIELDKVEKLSDDVYKGSKAIVSDFSTEDVDMQWALDNTEKFCKDKAVYNAVNRVKNDATKLLVPGTLWAEYHVEVGKLMTSELLGLGLIDKADVQNENPDWPAYKKYFMHGTSHHMGLDTHDYGLLHEPMQANMVFTVEPGIYIPQEGFGIRLEDDVVIQANGEPFNLMRNIPIESDEIESLMNK